MRSVNAVLRGGSAPATPGFNAVAPEWLYGAAEAAPAVPAAESTLGSHPCVALSSAQVLPEWINRNLAGKVLAANGDNPLNFVSHSKGSLHQRTPFTLPSAPSFVKIGWSMRRRWTRGSLNREVLFGGGGTVRRCDCHRPGSGAGGNDGRHGLRRANLKRRRGSAVEGHRGCAQQMRSPEKDLLATRPGRGIQFRNRWVGLGQTETQAEHRAAAWAATRCGAVKTAIHALNEMQGAQPPCRLLRFIW
jgi:hypothetical protein